MSKPSLDTSRRQVIRTGAVISGLGVIGLGSSGTALANPGKPDFSPNIWGDGEKWGTKGAAALPPPTDKNEHSFDKLFVVTNPVTDELDPETLPVSEAAPGNPSFNGGRWFTHVAAWNEAGITAHGSPPPLLTSYEGGANALKTHYDLGHIDITAGSPGGPGAPPDYFECPLLPVKE